jgi:hypothetical protein
MNWPSGDTLVLRVIEQVPDAGFGTLGASELVRNLRKGVGRDGEDIAILRENKSHFVKMEFRKIEYKQN